MTPLNTPDRPPIIWTVAGTDSGGGAGISADQRAADAFGVHLCPIVAAVTAQNSVAVTQIQAIDAQVLQAQFQALADDLSPHVIKTGLLGSVANVQALARTVDVLRSRHPVALVVDPVLRASTGADFADEALLQAYREWLLPRATVITPNRREAARLLGQPELSITDVPLAAAALQALGPATVCITGGDDHYHTLAHDWLHSPHAQGWLTLPRVPTTHHHGTGCTFASGLASAMACGFVSTDAAVLAKMMTTDALRHAHGVGQGPGPVHAHPGFSTDPTLLPRLSLGPPPPDHWPTRDRGPAPGLYAIVDSADRVEAVVQAGAATVQLRVKPPTQKIDTWTSQLRQEIELSARAATAVGARLVLNDHWREAIDLGGVPAVHLGQEDLLALSDTDLTRLSQARAEGLGLGLSTHSLWELCRAHTMLPDYIACGPVWPTTTKDMPWIPQGLDNLAWWVRMSPAPVVAIGGILTPEQLEAAAACGAAGGCVVRGLGIDPAQTLPQWQAAWARGQQQTGSLPAPSLPHPSLVSEFATTAPGLQP